MREFARINEVKAGDTLVADGGFDCLRPGQLCLVKTDPASDTLYVECSHGQHALEGQLGGPFGGFDQDTHYVGFYKA